MEQNGLICKERRELEKLIHDCIGLISQNSRSASELARNAPGAQLEFQRALAENVTYKLRLETLRECLAVHERLHACRVGITPSETWPALVNNGKPAYHPNGNGPDTEVAVVNRLP